MSPDARKTYPVEVAGIERELPLFEIADGVRIAILNILGDTELIRAASAALHDELSAYNGDIIVSAEAKSIPLLYDLAARMDLPWVVLRKRYKPYMGNALKAETNSITTGATQTLYLDEKDRDLLNGKQVLLVDDVISTGSTLESMEELVERAAGQVVARAAIFTEGDRDQWQHVIALGHLPVFTDDA